MIEFLTYTIISLILLILSGLDNKTTILIKKD